MCVRVCVCKGVCVRKSVCMQGCVCKGVCASVCVSECKRRVCATVCEGVCEGQVCASVCVRGECVLPSINQPDVDCIDATYVLSRGERWWCECVVVKVVV